MLRILESQAPAKQNATDTINTLSSRLSSATLLEDRRAAILGLRSFAKTYPASVASGALRDLITSLKHDVEDSDTIKVVLETILMLFEPDPKSLEASDEIILWLADEFTQRQDNITILLDLLETGEFYLRLYSLQILSHVTTARPERTQEAIFTTPLGVSRIVAVLDDPREAARNEALLLLTALTPASTELQKVVAFENAFERIFSLIEADGALSHGSTSVQDGLSLLANLLKLNISNQSHFREIGCTAKLSRLLGGALADEASEDGVSDWIKPQRDMNVWGLLTVVQLFLIPGSQGTPLNQSKCWENGIVKQVLQLAFSPSWSANLRAKSLNVCADLIRRNATIQEHFGDLRVPKSKQGAEMSNGHGASTPNPKGPDHTIKHDGIPQTMNVVEALLQLALEPAPIAMFEVRLAAASCVKAFFEGHAGICVHVLRRAVDGHKSGDDEIPNMLSVLLESPDLRTTTDPYQIWIASVLLLHLLYDNAETKAMVLAVVDGNVETGEEVITSVQSVAGNIIAGVQRSEDERILIGYLMLLCTWLFEDPDAVNDLLSEGSHIQSLIQATKISSQRTPLVAGLCTVLLGILYEFSSKDSPIPRVTLHGLLLSSLGRETYIDRLTKLRENGFVRDFEVMPQVARVDGGLPEVFFDKTFVDFLKDNFSRILRAIDRDPGLEISVLTNGVQKGISRELVDSLRAQLDDRTKALQSSESEAVQLKSKLEQEELEHRRTRELSIVELGRIRQINESLHKNHEEELRKTVESYKVEKDTLLKRHQLEVQDAEERLAKQARDADSKMNGTRERTEAEIADLKNVIVGLEARLSKANHDHAQDLQTAHEEFSAQLQTSSARAQRAEQKAAEAEERAQRFSIEAADQRTKTSVMTLQLADKETARQDVQTELDDLLVVFADLEVKRTADKRRLRSLGEEVSDDEDEADNQDDEEGEEEDNDKEGDGEEDNDDGHGSSEVD